MYSRSLVFCPALDPLPLHDPPGLVRPLRSVSWPGSVLHKLLACPCPAASTWLPGPEELARKWLQHNVMTTRQSCCGGPMRIAGEQHSSCSGRGTRLQGPVQWPSAVWHAGAAARALQLCCSRGGSDRERHWPAARGKRAGPRAREVTAFLQQVPARQAWGPAVYRTRLSAVITMRSCIFASSAAPGLSRLGKTASGELPQLIGGQPSFRLGGFELMAEWLASDGGTPVLACTIYGTSFVNLCTCSSGSPGATAFDLLSELSLKSG